MNAPVAGQRLSMTLEDRYRVSEGWLYMTGTQALVRLPIQQRLRDAAAGLNTGAYISGYRGSPLGRYDLELWAAGTLLKEHNIVFRSGLNEDLAATAIWGAQYVGSFGHSSFKRLGADLRRTCDGPATGRRRPEVPGSGERDGAQRSLDMALTAHDRRRHPRAQG